MGQRDKPHEDVYKRQGSPLHSFSTLLAELATITRNTCSAVAARHPASTFQVITTPNPKQIQALKLVDAIQTLSLIHI